MAPATHQPAPSDTKGNASRQLAVVVVFGRRVAPAPWRLTFEALVSWVVLSVGGSGLAVGAYPQAQATCRACDSAPVVPPLPVSPFRAAKKKEIIPLDEEIWRGR
jgi:hypothetical protein